MWGWNACSIEEWKIRRNESLVVACNVAFGGGELGPLGRFVPLA